MDEVAGLPGSDWFALARPKTTTMGRIKMRVLLIVFIAIKSYQLMCTREGFELDIINRMTGGYTVVSLRAALTSTDALSSAFMRFIISVTLLE